MEMFTMIWRSLGDAAEDSEDNQRDWIKLVPIHSYYA